MASQAIDWTTRELLAWMTRHFESKGLEAPRIVAEMLLANVLGCERMRLYMEVDRQATDRERETLRALVVRASAHEPVQYLVGRASFFAREFEVDPSTMIPQPSTEDLVSIVLDWWREHPPDREPGRLVADVGTGSGCIAVSLALHEPRARIVATDIVPAALALARRNAARLGGGDRITFIEGFLLEPLRAHAPPGGAGGFDCICSNPPYVSDVEWEGGQVERSVKEHVPASALRGGPDGLDLIRPLVAGAPALLRPGGLLAVEIGCAQGEAVLDLAAAAGDLANARVLPDCEGHPRVLLAERGRA